MDDFFAGSGGAPQQAPIRVGSAYAATPPVAWTPPPPARTGWLRFAVWGVLGVAAATGATIALSGGGKSPKPVAPGNGHTGTIVDQREKGWDASARADLRNAAVAEETFLTDNDHYTASLSDLAGAGFRATSGVVVSVVLRGEGYCVQATSESGAVQHYANAGGNVATGPC